MDLEIVKNPLILVGMAIALAMKTLDMMKTAQHRNAQRNGDNPVVRAIQEEGRLSRVDAAEREVRKSAQLAAHESACNQRMRDHDARHHLQP